MHHELAASAVHAHLLVADLAEQISTRARHTGERQGQFVLLQPRFMRVAQGCFRAEVAIGGYKSADPLVRPEEVVVRNEVLNALARILQIFQLDALEEFALHRLPETLALANRFWMVRARHRVMNSLLAKQFLEVRLAAPREVLPALVGQDLARPAEARNAIEQCLLRDLAALVDVQPVADDEARKVVQEDDQVHAQPRARDHEARDVRLPKLVRERTLEAPWQRA